MPTPTSTTPPFGPEQQLESLRLAAERYGVSAKSFAPAADAQVLAGSVRLHYLDWGSAGKPDVLFLHGVALTAHTWDLVCLSLREDYRCIAMDLRGHGDSEWPADHRYGITNHGRDVERFIAAVGLERPVVVGMSMGGMTALQYAARHSELLAGLVIVDVGTTPPRRQGVDRLRSFVDMEHEHDSVDGFVEQALQFNPRRDPELLRVSLAHNLRQLASGRWGWKYDRQHLFTGSAAEHAHAMQAIDERLSALRCPTMIVRGAESDLFSDEDAQAMAAKIPGSSRVQIEGAGHNVQGDNPADLAEALRGFLAGLDDPR
jgi:pimeloyl-ACP methyl ester carboxylesterase